jgi:NAD(P)-dependent dehydrogenase (short-subunit alcohol dehydrogenase family)
MRLALDGANVILNYGTGGRGVAARERAEGLCSKIAELNTNVVVLEAAVHSEVEVKEMFGQARSRFGSVDILVNNAGGLWIEQDFAAISTQHWDQAIRPEIDGTFFCIREALSDMRGKQWGRIVNICLDLRVLDLLVNAVYGHVLARYPFDFAIAKTAKAELARLLALTELKHGITINNVLPGIIEEMSNDDALQIIRREARQSVYFNPVDVAEAVAWLCRDEARAITQSDIRVPGNVYKRLGSGG